MATEPDELKQEPPDSKDDWSQAQEIIEVAETESLAKGNLADSFRTERRLDTKLDERSDD
jgi:hypothetical protein